VTLGLLELVALGVAALAVCGFYLQRLLGKRHEIPVGIGKSFGRYSDLDVNIATTDGGRRYVALSFTITQVNRPNLEGQVLLTSEQAAKLVGLLRVAVAPGRTVAVARAQARASARREQGRS